MKTIATAFSASMLAAVMIGCAGDDPTIASTEGADMRDEASAVTFEGDGAVPPEPTGALGAGTYEVDVSHRTYLAWGPLTHACTKPLPLTVYAPRGAPKSPVFLYLPGTGALADAENEADAAARAFAARGVLSAVVPYASLSGFACDAMKEKAECTFSDNKPASAVSAVCALPGADCSRGIVVGGMSQGAAMAALSRNYTSRARAAWLMGFGGGQAGDPFRECYLAGQTAFANNQIRVVNGQSDNQNVANLNASLGTACLVGQVDCLRPDGSGSYRVPDSQVEDGRADHCFFVAPDASGSEVGCSNFPPRMDKGWALPAKAPWSLLTNLDWLASKCD